MDALKPEVPGLEPVYPTMLVEDEQIFERGERKIVVQWIGRANTDGDLIVWLPEEKILVTGDILVAPIPYAFDAPMLDWPETLERLAGFDTKQIVPGHGAPQEDAKYALQVSSLIRDTVEEVRTAAKNGAAYEDLREAVDLTAHKAVFAGDNPWAVNAWNSYYLTPGLTSAWVALGLPVPETEE